MSKHDKNDVYFKWFLVFAFLYMLGHIINGFLMTLSN
jgi:hypothetical protein